jgi:multisubunit Na+/H+ antiporter MnhF subunit
MSDIVDYTLILAAIILSIAAAISLARIIRGPSQIDRVVGTELLTGVLIAMLALAGWSGLGVHALDVAIGLALVGFLGSVGLAAAIAPKGIFFSRPSSKPDATNDAHEGDAE